MKPKMLSTHDDEKKRDGDKRRGPGVELGQVAMYCSQTADVVDAAAGHQHNLRLRTKPQTRR